MTDNYRSYGYHKEHSLTDLLCLARKLTSSYNRVVFSYSYRTSMPAPETNVNRQAIRAFIEQQRGVLELAQANGTLARTKLDLKDAAESAFSNVPAEMNMKFHTVFDQELEAFCADLRLATVTVQHQIEREVPEKSGNRLAWVLGSIVLALVGLFLIVGTQSETAGQIWYPKP